MSLRFALVQDWLTTFAGAEKVLELIYKLYPAPIYTLVHDRNALKETAFANAAITPSFIERLPFGKRHYRYYLPLFPLAIESFDLSAYDIIISSSHAVAKNVLSHANQIHICYCHTPMRYAWDLTHHYLKNEAKGLKRLLATLSLHSLRTWDSGATARVDKFIANSHYIARRIAKVYRREAQVIYPPVDVDQFPLCTQKEPFYLTLSRLVPYKKVKLLVEAFSHMPDKKLVVVGDGPEMAEIKSIATSNIDILGYQPQEKLPELLGKARAFLFAAEEDFGISPVEAQACGTPVIAYGRGGACETVIANKTGLFFPEQTVAAVIEAVKEFEKRENSFDPVVIRQSALRFSPQRFMQEMQEAVERAVEEAPFLRFPR